MPTMRAHTAPGTAPARALAPEPTAAGFRGNRVRGWAPACSAGSGPALREVAVRGRGGVLIRGAVLVAGRGMGFGVMLVLDAAEVIVEVDRADEVAAPVAAGEPAPQPARARQAIVLAVAVALVVRLRGIVRSVRLGERRSHSATANREYRSCFGPNPPYVSGMIKITCFTPICHNFTGIPALVDDDGSRDRRVSWQF